MLASRQLRAADPSKYLVGDAGDAGFTMSMIWQAGGQPFEVDGTDVTVDLQDEGATRFAEMWQPMLDEELAAPITTWTDEWYQALADGTIATLIIGAWMPSNLESGVPTASGKWRVAPMAQWEEDGALQTAENGGSALVVIEASENKDLAYAFVEFSNAGEGVQVRLDQGTFPATTADLQSEEFLGREFGYFGGQKVTRGPRRVRRGRPARVVVPAVPELCHVDLRRPRREGVRLRRDAPRESEELAGRPRSSTGTSRASR